jgi:hypothetical protein
MAQNRMQVREDLRLGAFMPPAYRILVVCQKMRQVRHPAGVSLSAGSHDDPALRPLQLPALRSPMDDARGVSPLRAGAALAQDAVPQECLVDPESSAPGVYGAVITADLREERMPERSSRRLSSALPRWLIAGKNRDNVVRCLKKLREKLEATKLD